MRRRGASMPPWSSSFWIAAAASPSRVDDPGVGPRASALLAVPHTVGQHGQVCRRRRKHGASPPITRSAESCTVLRLSDVADDSSSSLPAVSQCKAQIEPSGLFLCVPEALRGAGFASSPSTRSGSGRMIEARLAGCKVSRRARVPWSAGLARVRSSPRNQSAASARRASPSSAQVRSMDRHRASAQTRREDPSDGGTMSQSRQDRIRRALVAVGSAGAAREDRARRPCSRPAPRGFDASG